MNLVTNRRVSEKAIVEWFKAWVSILKREVPSVFILGLSCSPDLNSS